MGKNKLVLKWLDRYGLALWVSGAFLVGGILWISSPEFAVSYTPPGAFQIVSVIVSSLGLVAVPAAEIYSRIAPAYRTVYFGHSTVVIVEDMPISFWSVFMLMIISALLGWGLWKLTKINHRRRLLQIVFGTNLLIAWFFLLQSPILSLQNVDDRYQLRTSCDFTISATSKIQVQYFATLSIEKQQKFAAIPTLYDTYYFISWDNGQNWQRFLIVSNWQGDCDHFKTSGRNNISLNEKGVAVYTRDGGKTWIAVRTPLSKSEKE